MWISTQCWWTTWAPPSSRLHLLEMGHPPDRRRRRHTFSSTGEERLRGLCRGPAGVRHCRRAGADPHGQPRPSGPRLHNELLALPHPPSAIFAGNNLLTLGALRAIHERGLRIPEDIGLAAFDEMEWMYFVKPALTVVAQPTYDVGRTAVELLLQRMETPTAPTRRSYWQPRCIYANRARLGQRQSGGDAHCGRHESSPICSIVWIHRG